MNKIKVALAMCAGVTSAHIKALCEEGFDMEDCWKKSSNGIADIFRQVGSRIDPSELDFAFHKATEEITFMTSHGISGIFITDKDFPLRLREIPDSPKMIHILGSSDFDSGKPLAVVGTRRPTSYGASCCRDIVRKMSESHPDLNVVSGLAYGVDALAHQTSLECGVRTTAVVAHGLATIYPAQHRDLAKRILASGGSIVSEYPSGVKPFRKNFLERNRIVAAMTDATVVVESSLKGGAMSTANHAFQYNRDVLAVPGRISDQMSDGCNHLISVHKADILSQPSDITRQTGWASINKKSAIQPSLFPELGEEQTAILEVLSQAEKPVSLDRLHLLTSIPVHSLTSIISEMEFDSLVCRHPGNRFSR